MLNRPFVPSPLPLTYLFHNLPSPENLLAHRPHRHLNHSKRPRTNRQRPHHRRSYPSPEPSHPLLPPHLPETVPHTPILPPTYHPILRAGRTKPVTLHFRFDHIQRIRSEPEGLAGKTTVERDERSGDRVALDGVGVGVAVHQVFEGEEPIVFNISATSPLNDCENHEAVVPDSLATDPFSPEHGEGQGREVVLTNTRRPALPSAP